jgi:multiple sugar transport system substrate-binding protein
MAVDATTRSGVRGTLMRRSKLTFLLLLAFTLLLAACGDNGDDDVLDDDPATDDEAADDEGEALSPSDEDVTIEIWFGRDDFQPDDAFDSFMEEHPNITVESDTIPLEQAAADFVRQHEAGDAPDIFQLEFSQIGILSRRDMAMDIQPILDTWQEENPELYDDLAPITWEMATWEGTPHGLALHHGPYWHVYRSDVLEEIGADEPETWDDVLEVGRQVVEETDMRGYAMHAGSGEFPMWAIGVFGQMGGQFEDDVMQIDSEAGHAWLEFYQELSRDGIVHPDTVAWLSGDSRAAFIGGQGAQIGEGMNLFPEFQDSLEYTEEWAVRAEPVAREGAEDEARHLSGGWPYFVNSDTEHPYEVGLVLQYLADFDQALSVAVRYQPVSNVAVMSSDEYQEGNPWAEELIDVWEDLEPRPAHVNEIAMLDVIQDANQWALENPDATDEVPDRAAEWQQQLDELADEVPDPEDADE